MITKADKGKTIVIKYVHEYNTKVYGFINNNFQLLSKNPTDKYQKNITNTLKQCNQITDKKQIKYLTQKKPRTSTLKAQIKQHKPGKPIRPVVNINAPAYKVAKHLTKTLNDYLNLSYQ
jgi:ribosomal protein S8